MRVSCYLSLNNEEKTVRGEDVFAEGVAILRKEKIASATTAARLLLCFVLKTDDFRMRIVSFSDIERFCTLISQHKAGCPVSKLIGSRAFWDRVFYVDESVFDPRPDSETLIEAVLETIPGNATGQILDLGTGSGCLLETLLVHRPCMRGIGVDCSQQALLVAQKNAVRLGIADRVHFVCSNWDANLTRNRTFEVIISNPPYIPSKDIPTLPKAVLHDPFIALDGGEDGLACYREIASFVMPLLKHRGQLFLEIGEGQQKAVKKIFNILSYVRSYKDLSKIVRILHFTKE
jgi:release factor glutamine methyltransferase